MMKSTLRVVPFGSMKFRAQTHLNTALRRRHGVWAPSILLRPFTTTDSKEPSGADQHLLFEQQMEDMKAEREALFGFTEKDHNAWSNANGHKHDASFMEIVDQARRNEDLKASGVETPLFQSPAEYDEIPNLTETTSKTLTHLSSDGKDVRMVDVGSKEVTRRIAVAESKVVFPPEVLEMFSTDSSGNEMVGPKGPIFATAKIAGIMAAK